MSREARSSRADVSPQCLVRKAQEKDAEAACEVLRRSIIENCTEDHRGEERLLAAWLANKTPEHVRDWFTMRGNYTLLAEKNGKVVGVASMYETGHVTLCYILPEVLFSGVGKALLAGLEAKARDLGLDELDLHSTRTAYAFYQRNGFEASGQPDVIEGIAGFPMNKKFNDGP